MFPVGDSNPLSYIVYIVHYHVVYGNACMPEPLSVLCPGVPLLSLSARSMNLSIDYGCERLRLHYGVGMKCDGCHFWAILHSGQVHWDGCHFWAILHSGQVIAHVDNTSTTIE